MSGTVLFVGGDGLRVEAARVRGFDGGGRRDFGTGRAEL